MILRTLSDDLAGIFAGRLARRPTWRNSAIPSEHIKRPPAYALHRGVGYVTGPRGDFLGFRSGFGI